ncbi:hypothetical protein GCM10010156_63460 [Planobispora rosea]|uniref:Uncharacterized protein n=1 Tax=Planobispora rosea TaxID=35762 RepID=A0A8J3S6I5_PLARO|nr:hypothetical protein GCM10010156_63460 [Planobispora rosea]GIH87645.1 hypothetical protein Pro02_60530 [Planobispora rosea]
MTGARPQDGDGDERRERQQDAQQDLEERMERHGISFVLVVDTYARGRRSSRTLPISREGHPAGLPDSGTVLTDEVSDGGYSPPLLPLSAQLRAQVNCPRPEGRSTADRSRGRRVFAHGYSLGPQR